MGWLRSGGPLVLAVSAVSTAVGQPAATGPGALARTQGGELTAEVADRAAWCSPDVILTIRGQDDRYFSHSEKDAKGRPGLITLQRLLGVIRVGLESGCPQAKTVTFNGYVDDVFVYRGYAEKRGASGEWILLELPVALMKAPPPRPATAPALAAAGPSTQPGSAPASAPQSASAVADCDRLAAHPDDPQRPKGVRGVADDQLKAGPALKTCEEAVAALPDEARLRFQLARALISYDKVADGVESMTEAAEMGSGAATAALGDITLFGLIDDTPDPVSAKKLYQQAASLGFKPAVALAAAIEANPQEDTSPQVAEPKYHHPDRASQMVRGEELPGSGGAFIATLAYSTRFIAGIVYACPKRGVDITPQQIFNSVYRRAGPAATLFGLSAVGDGAYATLQQEGMDDGNALAESSGCDSNMVAAAEQSLRKTIR